MDIYKVVVERPLVIRYGMGDAEDAQLNGVEQTLAAPLSKNSKYLVYRRIYEMHYARDATEFMSIQERADGL
ncbi:hypothetical protein PPTG_24692 [Phytophthora nicotianae INRA-310]|uniref:Uncharacterized protein n=1 Tax=Phytophthora nicotianae (strain INRA-310) TaxID=761204 RepID=W2PBK6_PHYN3|nr:hypothetical protein PPTG_24692 [Phytophthora nicotianae INRA-310]ETM98216.1 hypothetical protein PPTG_24692 [Phytophthora nicotianae INRA-310]